MNQLTDINTIRRTLEAHGFHFSRLRGQNFLVDAEVPQRMAALFGKTQSLLEIGPGFGALTHALCQQVNHVTAIEVDNRLLPILRDNLRNMPNLTLVQGDALTLDLSPLTDGATALCANLPYAITTPLLTRLLETTGLDPMVLMVQREVADRLTALPGTPSYGAVTLFCALYVKIERLFDVTPDCFVPRPKVTSSVIRLVRHTEPPVPQSDRKAVTALYRAAFAQRRKTLLNALSAGTGRPKEALSAALAKAGIDPMARGETLSLQDYWRLSQFLQKETTV